MAGNYMDAPAQRLAYDRDGSIGVLATAAGALTAMSNSDLQYLNNESEDAPTISSKSRVILVFSAPIDIEALFIACGDSTSYTIETSKNTTTGLDGTWTSQVATASYLRDVKPFYRVASNLTAMLATSTSDEVKGVRLSASGNGNLSIRALHVYGNLSSSATEDRLVFWDPSASSEVPPEYFDWGDVARATSGDLTFRLHNMSSTLAANSVTLYAEALTPGVPSVAGMLLFSDDGTTFTSSLALGTIAAGATSGVLYVRRNTPSNAQVSVWSPRIVADVASWT